MADSERREWVDTGTGRQQRGAARGFSTLPDRPARVSDDQAAQLLTRPPPNDAAVPPFDGRGW